MNNERKRKKDSARVIWDSKPRRAPNPKDVEFQTAEVVIPNPAHRDELPLSFKDGIIGEADIDKQKVNRLIWGDNLLAMQALLTQGYEGKINLIYIDPPFDSKADYSHKMMIEGNEFTKEPSVIERLAYKDTWVGGTDSYLDMLYPRLQLMKRLLSEGGSIYVHLDWHVGHYVKVILDEVFGNENLRNEIIWKRSQNISSIANIYRRSHDSIYFYARSNATTLKRLYKKHDEKYLSQYKYSDEKGKYRHAPLLVSGKRFGTTGKPWKGIDPNIHGRNGMHWITKPEKLEVLDAQGLIYWPRSGGQPMLKYYLDDAKGSQVSDVWDDINLISPTSEESLSFDTQKPEALLERIIKACSNEGDVVADFFAGSGTTFAVAEKLNRRWIGCELGKVGIQVTRSRLVEQQAKPFLIENIGNYQREMIYLTGGRIWEMQHLILKLYGATPRDKTSGLGIRKVENIEELVYVGYPDRPITAKKAEELAVQAQKLDGRGYKRLVILGWDYEYNYHQALEARHKALKDKLKVQIKSRDIPPDIYDYLKKAKSEEDIEALADKVHFYERPYLRLNKPEIKDVGDQKVRIKIGIKRYVLMDIPVSHTSTREQETYNALMKLAKDHSEVLIDYWAVDWDYDGFTFKSQWQAFRGNGKKARTVPIVAVETLEKKKKRSIAVRVVDIFGNDAGATLETES